MLAIETRGLTKKYKSGLNRKEIVALDNLNLRVKSGEVLGYIGHNGSGKTTTFKLLLGLIKPTSGSAGILGKSLQKLLEVLPEIGFLPEQPHFYDSLTGRQFLDFYGQLFGMKKEQRQLRTEELLDAVDIKDAADVQLRKYSRGMLQRIGIAQALINDPKLVILDEPMASLDPVGRKHVRDLILSLKLQGKTIIFSSHILSDVEMICDRVAIINKGKLQKVCTIDEMLDSASGKIEMVVKGLQSDALAHLQKLAENIIQKNGRTTLIIPDQKTSDEVLPLIGEYNAKLVSMIPQSSLEDLFMRTLSSFSKKDSPTLQGE